MTKPKLAGVVQVRKVLEVGDVAECDAAFDEGFIGPLNSLYLAMSGNCQVEPPLRTLL